MGSEGIAAGRNVGSCGALGKGAHAGSTVMSLGSTTVTVSRSAIVSASRSNTDMKEGIWSSKYLLAAADGMVMCWLDVRCGPDANRMRVCGKKREIGSLFFSFLFFSCPLFWWHETTRSRLLSDCLVTGGWCRKKTRAAGRRSREAFRAGNKTTIRLWRLIELYKLIGKLNQRPGRKRKKKRKKGRRKKK
jgi:hypothetical protein